MAVQKVHQSKFQNTIFQLLQRFETVNIEIWMRESCDHRIWGESFKNKNGRKDNSPTNLFGGFAPPATNDVYSPGFRHQVEMRSAELLLILALVLPFGKPELSDGNKRLEWLVGKWRSEFSGKVPQFTFSTIIIFVVSLKNSNIHSVY